LLIAFTALSVVVYLLCVRPTQVAENFVAAIKRGDFKELDSLSVDGVDFADRFVRIPNLPPVQDADITLEKADINGGLSPRPWRDVIRFRRVCYVEFAYPRMDQVKPGEYQAYVTVVLTAGIIGVKERAWTSGLRQK
jgi:hypothetical protein